MLLPPSCLSLVGHSTVLRIYLRMMRPSLQSQLSLCFSLYPCSHRADNRMQQLDSCFSSLSFSSTMSNGVIKKPDLPLSPSVSYGRHFVAQEEESPYYPSFPLSPVFGQSNKQQLSWHQNSGDDTLGPTPRNNYAEYSFIHSKHAFSPSLDTRSSQFSAVKNQQDPLTSFSPPPIQLDASEEIGRFDNTGHFLSDNDNHRQSPFSPRNHGSKLSDAGFTRERSFSSPGTYLRQPSYGAKSPQSASAGQILHEDKPLSWNGGSGFPAQSNRGEANSSPSHYETFNSSRPPRHSSTTKDTQTLLPPRVDRRHGLSDCNLNMLCGVTVPSHMSPIANYNPGRFQSPGSVIGSSSFESSFQGGRLKDRHSLGSMDTL
jgi:hypothetical protein